MELPWRLLLVAMATPSVCVDSVVFVSRDGLLTLPVLGAVSCGVCGLGEALHEGEEGWCLADEQSGVCEEGEGAHGRTGCFGGADDRADRELAVEEDLWVRA